MGMNEDLARIYGTASAHTPEDLEKEAQAKLFAKLAADEGIDLRQLNDEQIDDLWNQTFPKTAEEKCGKCKMAMSECKCPAEGEKEAAAAEFQVHQEQRQKLAEADHMGRVMAHAYVDELNKIAEANGLPPQFQKKDEESKEEKDEGKKDEEKEAGIHPAALRALRGGQAKTASAPATGTSTPAIDNLAIERAVKLASEAGFDATECAHRISALVTLGQFPSGEKTASAQSLEQAVEIRALEFLEQAKYPVSWQ